MVDHAVAAPQAPTPAPSDGGTREIEGPHRGRRVPSGRWRRLGTGYTRAVAALTLLALAARVIALDHQSLWRDEAFTELVSRRSWSGMFHAVSQDSGTPLSYVLTHLAMTVSSTTTALRLPAAIVGTAAIPLCAALARRLGGDRAGICAAAVAAVAPTLLLSARDSRMYALAGTLVLAMALTAWRAVEQPDRRRLLAHAAVVAAALLTDWLAAVAVVMTLVGAVLALGAGRRALLRLAAASALGAVPLLVLWVPFATAQFAHANQGFWVPPIDGPTLLGVLTQYLAGPAVDADLPQRTVIFNLQAATLVASSIAGALVLFLIPWDPSRRRRGISYLTLIGVGSIVVLILVSLRRPILDARYASVVWPPLFALLGLGVSRLRWAAVVPLAIMAATSFAHSWYPTRADVATLVREQLNGRVGGSDLVVVSPDSYLQVLIEADPATAARTHVDVATLPWYWGVAAFPPGAYLAAVPADAGTVYLVTQPGNGWPAIPSNHVDAGQHCATRICVEVFVRR